jgi:diguanylate cyclase (GGDEF)-like protein
VAATIAVPIAEHAGTARVLIVEDDPDWAFLVGEVLGETTTMGFVATVVERVEDARRALAGGGVDCVLLDLSLPDARDLEGLLELQEVAPDVPVVILSGLEDEEMAVRAVRNGAQDYLPKSNADAGRLARSIQYAIERKRAEVELAHRALHDPLTGLPNRTYFLEQLEAGLARSARRGLRVGVLFLDLDGFKSVNDNHGHSAGDAVLAAVAVRLEGIIRPSDTLARFGGDEFVLLCEDLAGVGDVAALAGRLVKEMEAPFEIGDGHISVGLSIGIVSARGGKGASAEALIRDADRMMYRAKRQASPYELLEAIED